MTTNVKKLATPYKITIDVLNDELITEIDKYWNKNKHSIEVKGFRKGNVPQKVAEEKIGFAQLYRDVIPYIYSQKLLEENLKVIYNDSYEIFGNFARNGSIRIQSRIYLFPECKIPDFKKIDAVRKKVSEEDLSKEFKIMQEQHKTEVQLEDVYKAQRGDTVIIDFSGRSKDGTLISGAAAKGFSLVLGSNTFIPGFESQLVGCQKNKSIEVNVKFPENYKQEKLAGKVAVFDVDVKEIKSYEIPTIKHLAEIHQISEEELEDSVLKKLEEKFEKAYKADVLDRAVELAEMGPIPEKAIEQEIDLKYHNHLESIGQEEKELQNPDSLKNWFKNQQWDIIEQGVKSTLLMHKISDEYNITVTDQELQQTLAKRYNDMHLVQEVMNNQMKKPMELSKLRNEKTLNFIIEQKDR